MLFRRVLKLFRNGCVVLTFAAVRGLGAQSDSVVHSRAAQLAKSVAEGVEGRQSPESVLRVEREVGALDSLPGSVTDEKLFAHGVMVGYYETAGMPDLMRYHARAMIALAQKLDVASEVQFASIIFGAYQALADRSALEGRPREAAAILSAVPPNVAAAPSVAKAFASASGRYALVGSTMPPIVVPDWIGVAPSRSTDAATLDSLAPANGTHAVTLLEFTAYWCAPCQESYDYIKSLRTRFPGQPVKVILVTKRSGEFGTAKHLSKAEETRKLSDYFDAEQHLPFPIAVTDSASGLEASYFVDAYPEFVVENSTGAVIAVLRGWNPDISHVLTSAISEALK